MRFGFGVRPRGVACFLFWLVSTGCTPGRSDASSSRATDASEGASDGLTTTGGGPGSTTTGDTTSVPTTAASDATAAPEPTPVEPCESHDAERDCDAAGCIWFATERVTDLATCALEPAGVCASASASTGDEGYDSAFFKRVDGVLHVRRVGRKAGEFPGPEHPAGWTECGLGPAEPRECGCVCAAGRCPGDIALDLLEACAVPRPCPDVTAAEPAWDGEGCVYQALAAEAAARLRVTSRVGDRDVEDRVYVRGDGTATWMRGSCDGRDASCRDRKWELPRLCTLRDRAEFTACAAGTAPDAPAKCRDVAAWFVDCAPTPATCL